jgi:histidyl-tRNA synthetase
MCVFLGGGRYDNLMGSIKHRFSGKGGSIPEQDNIDAVGFSIGIERLFNILENKAKKKAGGAVRPNETLVYVASAGFKDEKMAANERLKIVTELWAAGIAAETTYDFNPKPRSQIQTASDGLVPFVIWIGSKELKDGVIRVKSMKKEKEEDVPRNELVATMRRLIALNL